MAWAIFIASFAPLLAFVLIETRFGLRSAIKAAILVSIIEIYAFYLAFGYWDYTSLSATVLLTGLGYLSIRLQRSEFFKLQPVIMSLGLALLFAYHQFFDEPLVIKYLPRIKPLLSSEQQSLLSRPETLSIMTDLSGIAIFALVLHSGLVAYAALRLRNVTWLVARTLGFWPLLLAISAIHFSCSSPI